MLALGGAVAWLVVAGQVGFYLLAAAGRRIQRLAAIGYIPRFLVDSNIAAVRGLWRHLAGTQTALWHRVERIET